MNYEKERLQKSGHLLCLSNIKGKKSKTLFTNTSYSSNKPWFIYKNGSEVRCEKLTERRLRKRNKNEKTI